jgi:hypothetical protein
LKIKEINQENPENHFNRGIKRAFKWMPLHAPTANAQQRVSV